MLWYSLQILSVGFLILRIIQRDVINVRRSSCKAPVILSVFNVNLEFSQISDFIKIRRVGAELFREDGRTDMTKLTVTLRNFARAPKKRLLPSNKSCSVRGNV